MIRLRATGESRRRAPFFVKFSLVIAKTFTGESGRCPMA